jgi:hypothetical protein
MRAILRSGHCSHRAPIVIFDGWKHYLTNTPKDDLSGTKKLMGALGRMLPKPHKKMKIGKTGTKKAEKTKSRKR